MTPLDRPHRPDPAEVVGTALGIDDLPEHDDLFEHGLDSLTLIRIAGQWRRAGYPVTFEDLATTPTLAAWRSVLAGLDPAPAAPASVAVDESAPFDLATMQHAYWVGRSPSQPYGGVAAHFYVEFDGNGIDLDRLRAAHRELARRHGMLRARFLDDGRQRIAEESALPEIAVHDLRGLDRRAVDERLAELRESYSHQTLDVEAGAGLAIAVSLLPGGRTRMHVDLDMMIADALSMRILLNDLRARYERPDLPLPPIEHSYPRYLAERAARRDTTADRDWWRERLADLPAGPALPTAPDAGRAPARSARLHHWLGPEAKARLLSTAARHGVTAPAALATVFAEVVGAWSAGPRFLLNLPLFDREALHPDVDRLAGDFSTSILLDVDLTDEVPFAERALRVQTGMRSAIAHSGYGGVDVLRDLTRMGDGGPVLAPVVYTSAIGLGEIYDEDLQRCFGAPVWIISQGPQVWLDAQVTELDHGLLLNWDVRLDVLADGVADAAFAAYRALVDRVVDDPGAWARPVGPLLPDDQAEVRRQVNATDRDRSKRALHQAFLDQDPARTALISDDATTTYGELAERARRVAGALIARGVRPGDTVGITLPKGADQVIAALGVLCAGAAYLPIGVDQPAHRRTGIQRAGGAALVLTDVDHVAAVEEAGGCTAVLLADAVTARAADDLPAVDPDAVAYVLFTSGSTGTPKGVEVSHAAAVNTIDALNDRFGVGPADRVLTVSALEFDLSVYDVFGLLSVGGGLVLVDERDRRDAARWWRLVTEHGVTVWNTAPAVLDMLLTAAEQDPGATALRVVLLGGDWVGLDLPARLRKHAPDCRFAALGGMTEAAIHSTVVEVDEVPPHWRSMPWGVPLDNVRARVVDTRDQDRPDWVPGQLWIGGASVALGYRGDSERTAACFTEHDGVRWYRSGDLARYLPDGTLEFLGRADHQVQLRGHRVEPGEIESALEAHPAVRRAVVVALGSPVRELAAAVSRVDSTTVTAEDLRAWLTERVPAHMVCERIAVLDDLPLTRNGKLDRAAVATRLAERSAAPRLVRPPEGPVESAVATAWADLLGRDDPIGRDDSFFALGGDSLLATRLIGRLREAGIAGARVAALFADPTLAGFAATVTEGGVEHTAAVVVPDLSARHEPFPPTDVQRAYWIGRDERLPLGGVGTYQYAEFDGTDVDLERLQRAWQRLIDRHEMLRAVFDERGDQRILAAPPPFHIDIRDAGPDAEADLAALREEKSHARLDLTRWPLFDITAVRYETGGRRRTRVSIGLDYIVFDALSIMTVFTELDLLYRDPDADLPPIGVSFRDYVLQVEPSPEDVERDQAYWRTRLADLPPAPALPTTVHPSLITSPRFERRQWHLAPESWTELRRKAREHGLTPSTVLLAVYAEVLGAWSRQRELTITLTLFNRREAHPDIYRVLGDFTTLSLADYRPAPGLPWQDSAAALQRRMGADLDHRDVRPSWLLRELARATGSMETMPVVFTSGIGVGADEVSMDMSDTFPERVFGVSQSPQVSLDNQVIESGGGLQVTWDAVPALFHDGVLDAMFDAYTRALTELAESTWDRPLLPDVLPPAQRAVRERVNGTATPIRSRTLHGPVLSPADPASTALIWEQDGRARSMTHGELVDQASRVAGWLVATGVRPGDAVAITLPKGPDQIVAVLGVLAAGGVYVPVGVEQPALRRERIHTDARVRIAVTDLAEPLSGPALAEPVAVSPDASAYVIFTSGSTGAPKGVEITHDAAVNTIDHINARFDVGPADRVLALSALDFDLSVYDIFGVLGAGGALVLPAEDERRDAHRWAELVARHRVTLWNTVPMLLDMLMVAAGPSGVSDSLRLALVSGDWVGLDLRARLPERCALVALGGATEAAIWSNSFPVHEVPPEWKSIPYGHPLANQCFRVVDALGRDRPDWVPGELWIGGRGVAVGYRGDRARTAEKFVEHAGGRWYRTGDLGRYWPDGTLEFLGRTDQQVKIGGHRIELGEIEAAIDSCPGIGGAVAVAVGDRFARRVHAFVEPADPAVPVDEVSLRGWLADRLPGYAVPAAFTTVDSVPLTANGKVDRAALAELATAASGTGAAPAGPVETAVAELWTSLLEQPPVDRETNFFASGGTSLLMLRLVTELRARFGVELPVRALLAVPTVAAVAAELVRLGVSDADDMESGEL